MADRHGLTQVKRKVATTAHDEGIPGEPSDAARFTPYVVAGHLEMTAAAACASAPAGLSDEEAARRLAADGPNALPGGGHHWFRLIKSILAEPMFLMLLVAAGIYIALGDRGEAWLLLGSVLIVIAITAVQEWRAHGALRALNDLAAPLAHVMRSGVERRVAAPGVVRGDLLVLREGDRVAADGYMVEGTLVLDESLLTGESVPVQREPCEGRVEIQAGTLVVGGQGRIVVTAIGGSTAIGAIGHSLIGADVTPSGLQRAAGRAVKVLAVVAFAIASLLVLLGWWWGGLRPLDAALGGIALAMAILPEEVPVVLTVFYALGARRIARHGVLTRRLAAVEAVGAISLLAVDKTGTLTQNRMMLVAIVDADGSMHQLDQPWAEPAARVAEAAFAATPHDSMDPTDAAVRDFVMAHGASSLPAPPSLLREFPVGNGRAYISRVISEGAGERWHVATKGAPEAVQRLCRLSVQANARVTKLASDLAMQGLRVLAVARSASRCGDLPTDPSAEPHDFIGFIGLADPLRPDVPAAMAECRAAGIRVLMLTGDHPATAAAIARQAGLRGDRLLTGADIDELDDRALSERLRAVDVCARVQPAQKLRLVRALQHDGHTVAMTGDGVNDAPALRAADVGVAMGERGSDVAREAADLILLNDDFASLVTSVRLGRRIYDNVHKAIRFISAAHVPIVMLALFPLLMRWPPLLLPAQIVLLEMIIDPACSIVLEATEASAGVMRRRPRDPHDTPFSLVNIASGLLRGIGVGAILVAAYALPVLGGMPAAHAALPTFLGILGCTVTLVLASDRGEPSAGGGTFLGPGIVVLAMAIGGMVTSFADIRHVMGFTEPNWLVLVVPPVCICLTLGWIRLIAYAKPLHRSTTTSAKVAVAASTPGITRRA